MSDSEGDSLRGSITSVANSDGVQRLGIMNHLDPESLEGKQQQEEEENTHFASSPSPLRKIRKYFGTLGEKTREEGIVTSVVSTIADEPIAITYAKPDSSSEVPDESLIDEGADVDSNDPSTSSLHPTFLHAACAASNDISLDELRSLLLSSPEAASIADSDGRLPLHILSENKELLNLRVGRELAGAFAWDLIAACPEGIFKKDKTGCIPFAALLRQWVHDVHESTAVKPSEMEPYNLSILSSLYPSQSDPLSILSSLFPSQPNPDNTPPQTTHIDDLFRRIPSRSAHGGRYGGRSLCFLCFF
mmetsp:Transcript_12020/g.17798  ORF Transcript_12020/g.17798 Transcript_12020/m.17798 type:complete len:304 (-) Transcript_12020:82-993(-)